MSDSDKQMSILIRKGSERQGYIPACIQSDREKKIQEQIQAGRERERETSQTNKEIEGEKKIR